MTNCWRPGYNLPMGAQNQYVLGYSIHGNAADKVNLVGQLDNLSFIPKWICADAGYDSLYDFELLAARNITAVIKVSGKRNSPKPYSRYAMEYEYEADQTTARRIRRCPLPR